VRLTRAMDQSRLAAPARVTGDRNVIHRLRSFPVREGYQRELKPPSQSHLMVTLISES